jgi:hypothetical protein
MPTAGLQQPNVASRRTMTRDGEQGGDVMRDEQASATDNCTRREFRPRALFSYSMPNAAPRCVNGLTRYDREQMIIIPRERSHCHSAL